MVVGVVLGLFSFLADGRIPLRLFELLGNIATPWALTAWLMGRRAPSSPVGAAVGLGTLLVSAVTYYSAATLAEYALDARIALWFGAAVVIGPILGWSGAATRRSPAASWPAVIAASVLLAEALFLMFDRRIWLWNLVAEPHRLNDLAVIIALVAGAVTLPVWLVRDRRRLVRAMAGIGLLGTAGALLVEAFYRLLTR